MITPLLLGLLQGIFEWIPISSEGALAVSYSFLLNRELDEAVKYALWLHIATVPSVIVVFRNEFIGMVREILSLGGDISSFVPKPVEAILHNTILK